MILALKIFAAQFFQEMGALELFVQFSVLESISFDLSIHLIYLVFIFVVNQVFEQQNLVLVNVCNWHIVKILDHQNEIFPKICQSRSKPY